MSDKQIPDVLLSRKEAAMYLHICLATLAKLDIPRTKVRRKVFYMQAILDQWLAEHTEKRRKV